MPSGSCFLPRHGTRCLGPSRRQQVDQSRRGREFHRNRIAPSSSRLDPAACVVGSTPDRGSLHRVRLRAWSSPLFERAQARCSAGGRPPCRSKARLSSQSDARKGHPLITGLPARPRLFPRPANVAKRRNDRLVTAGCTCADKNNLADANAVMSATEHNLRNRLRSSKRLDLQQRTLRDGVQLVSSSAGSGRCLGLVDEGLSLRLVHPREAQFPRRQSHRVGTCSRFV